MMGAEHMTFEERIAGLESGLAMLRREIAALTGKGAAPARAAAAAPPAPGSALDRDLDTEYGNFTVRKSPPRWHGEDYAGKRLSECSPEFLDSLAGFLDWKSGKNAAEAGREKYAQYDAKDAARARGWAARLRAGWVPPSVIRPAPEAHPAAWDAIGPEVGAVDDPF